MSKRFDKRMKFIAECLNQKITDNPKLANEWYCSEKHNSIDIEELIRRFKLWIRSIDN